ncbi:MAG TPA: hypothetical protein VEC11_02925 [Allosphingosinicella sp.]|nr:hypothetical protein [Allosphingosinicella sp.]
MKMPVLLALAFPSLAAAQPASPPPAAACAAPDAALPADLATWRTPADAGATVAPGQAVTLAPTAPLTLVVAEAGTYGVAIDQDAWIDLSQNGAALPPIARGHGPACSTIRKIVQFALQPGRYTITLSRTQAPTIRLLVVRR